MMDLIKVHLFIMVALVTMSHSSMQQKATAATTVKSKSTVDTTQEVPSVITTKAPSKLTSVKSETITTVKVNDTNTSTSAPAAVTPKNVSDATTVKTTKSAGLKTTTTVSPDTGTQDKSTGEPALPGASTSSSSGTNKVTTTAAPILPNKNTSETTSSPVKSTATKGNKTQAPGLTTTETNKPATTATKGNKTQAPGLTTTETITKVTVAPTSPNTSSTEKPSTTAAPATTVNQSNASPKPTYATTTSLVNTKNTTAASTTASGSKTSPKVVTTSVPKTETQTTKTEAQTTSTKTKAQTTKTPTTVPKTEAPKTSKTVTKSSAGVTPSTTQAPEGSRLIYINEIVVDKNGTFQKIELHLSTQFDVTHYTMVIVDGETNGYMAVVNLTGILQQNGLLLINFNNTQSSPIVKDKGTGIAIYDTTQIRISEAWSGEVSGLMDALVIGKDYTLISQNLTQTLTPDVNPFVLDPNIYGQSRTISRCSSDRLRSTDMFALTNPSFGSDNYINCHERLNKFKNMAIKMSGIDCKLLEDLDKPETSDDISVRKVLSYVAKEVNKQCRCGLTLMHIIRSDTTVTCCDGASIDMRFVASSEQHLKELSDSYEMFIKNTKSVVIANKQYTLDSKCEGHCCQHHTVGPMGKSPDDNAKNIKVTVAVIVSCLVVFSIVVVIVIVYMKKKNHAVYQFRMSRLDEEDDLYNDGPDHEDFVGGQEATFDIKRR